MRLSKFTMRAHVLGDHCFLWKSNKFVSSGELHVWRDTKDNYRRFCESLFSWHVLFYKKMSFFKHGKRMVKDATILRNAKCSQVLNILLNDQSPVIKHVSGGGVFNFQCFRKTKPDFKAEKQKNFTLWYKVSPPIKVSNTRTCSENGWKFSIYGKVLSNSHWLVIWAINLIPFHLLQ